MSLTVAVGEWVRLRSATRFGRPDPFPSFAWRVRVLEVSEDGRFARVKGGSIKAKWVAVADLGPVRPAAQ